MTQFFSNVRLISSRAGLTAFGHATSGPWLRSAIAVGFAMTLSATAFAQETGSLLDAKSDSAQPNVKKNRDNDVNLPTAELEPTAAEWVNEMKGKYDEGVELLRESKNEKDPLKQNCVSDKLSLMKGVLRIAANASSTLSERLAMNQEAQARRQLHKIERNRSKMNALSGQAKNCTGAQSSFVGAAEVKVETSDALNQPESYYSDSSHFTNAEVKEASGSTGAVGESASSVPAPLPPVSLSSEAQ